MRLLFLQGYGVSAIADRIVRTREAVCRYMALHDLKRPETPLERHVLALEVAADLQIDALLNAKDAGEASAAAAMSVRLAGEARRMRTARGDTEDVAAEALAEQQAHVRGVIAGLVGGYETKSAGLGEVGAGLAAGGAGGGARPVSVPADLPDGAGEPSGDGLADMAVPGRAWGGQDARRGGMDALVGDCSARGADRAGRPDVAGCARSDDRGRERAKASSAAGISASLARSSASTRSTNSR